MNGEDEGNRVITVGLPVTLAEKLREVAAREERSMSSVVRRILTKAVATAPKPTVQFAVVRKAENGK